MALCGGNPVSIWHVHNILLLHPTLYYKCHLTKVSWDHNCNLVKILFAQILILVIQSCHNFAHAMTAQLLWHVQNYDMIGSFFVHESHIFFSCDQAALRTLLSVRPSVCHTFFTMFLLSYHHEIFRSYYQLQKSYPCKRSRSKVKVTEVTTQLNRFWTITPVWIQIWRRNDAQSLMLLWRGALFF